MASVTTLNSLDTVVREDLMFKERALEPKVDGVFTKIFDTSAGVVRGGGRGTQGTGWEVQHTFAVGVAGAFRNVAGDGDSYNDYSSQVLMGTSLTSGTPTAFPSTSDAASPGYVIAKLNLVEGLGVVPLPIHLLVAEQLPSTIAKPVSLIIDGTAKNVAQCEANNFYATDGSNIALATLVKDCDASGNPSVVFTDINATKDALVITFGDTADVTGRVARFYPGMTVSIFKSDFTDTRPTADPGDFLVGKVDYVQRIVTLIGLEGYDLSSGGANFEANDVIVQWNSVVESSAAYGPKGPGYWLVNSGTVYAIARGDYPQFNSVVTAVNNVLDQAVLDTNVGAFYDAYGEICDLDSFITTAGVLNNYVQNTDGLWRYERSQTGALKLKEGWSSFDYTYPGHSFEVLQSRYMQNGTLWALKMGGQNIKRYVTPRLPNSGRQAPFSDTIQWYGPLAGSSTIWMPARDTNAKFVRHVEAPFFCFREIAPDQQQGIALSGLTELFV